MSADTARDRLAAFLAATTRDPVLAATGGRPVGLGWATVELDRAARELGAAFSVPAARFVPAVTSESLGASARIATGALPGGPAIVLLEPSTEGRLAASLARYGEGPVAIWVAVSDVPTAVDAIRETGVPVSVEHDGPIGKERLLLDGGIHGPHRLIVELPGTIRA